MPRCRFSGIDSWNLCVDGEWVDEVSRPVQAYDAGTDSGLGFGTVENFVELDIDTDPAGPIVSFGQIRPKEISTFYNPSKCDPSPVQSLPNCMHQHVAVICVAVSCVACALVSLRRGFGTQEHCLLRTVLDSGIQLCRGMIVPVGSVTITKMMME